MSKLPEDLARPQTGPLSARLSALRVGPEVRVEIRSGDALADFDDAWRDLLTRADAPNVFMAPALLRQAAEGGARIVALLAWQEAQDGPSLAGLWAFSVGRPRRGLLPFSVLRAPATEHAYLATPVIDRDCIDATLAAMLDAIADAPGLPKTLMLNAMSDEGATAAALARVLAARGGAHCRLKESKRPKLVTGTDPKTYLESALSSATRKKLRQYRRRLAERGRLELTVAQAPDDVQRAADAFLQLEAEGWKGRCGTALLNRPEDAALARTMLAAFAASGEAFIHALELDGRPVSMQVVLRAGAIAFTWKTAYDESLRDVSPGMLLFEDYTKAFLADPSLVSVDSCAYDETSFMAGWSERQALVDLMLDARRGASAAGRLAGPINRHYLAARERAKQVWHASRARLAGLGKAAFSRRQPRAA